MTIAGRILVRSLSYISYCALIALTAILLLPGGGKPEWFLWLGLLFVLFLADRMLHYGHADRSLERLAHKGEVNVAHYLTPQSYSLIERSFERSRMAGGDFFLHLLRQLIKKKEILESLARIDVNARELRQAIENELYQSAKKRHTHEELLKISERLAIEAFKKALKSGSRFVEPKDIFSALTEAHSEHVTKIFLLFNINAADLEAALIFSRFKSPWHRLRLPQTLEGFSHRSRPRREAKRHVMNRAWTARPTPTLDTYGTDYTDLARLSKIGFLIGHEREYAQMIDALSRPGIANVLLIGDPGAGKETLIAHLASEMVRDRVPSSLFDKRLVALKIGSITAGVNEGELSGRLNKIVEEITAAGNIILYIPDIHDLVKTGGAGAMSAADILLPAIMNGTFPVIGATYPREFKQYVEQKTEFREAFEIVRIEEISESEAIKILTYESLLLEREYRLVISFGAIKQAVVLAHKYFRDKLLPGSAEELLKAALADAREQRAKVLSPEFVIKMAEQRVNIPIHRAGKAEAEKLLNLEKVIHERLVDQTEAVDAVARALREYRSGISRRGGPIAAFLFVGPTGVGKTELAKTLAHIQFGSEGAMVRFDMSEYQDHESVYRFIGAPDGSQGGTLTDAILQKPFSLILLDEFEKAHRDILNLFLQVFDDGRLTDSTGRTVDFKNTILIATSNALSDFIKTEIEKGRPIAEIADELKKKLAGFFPPELVNRFSDVIVFKNLSMEDTVAIARLQLGKLKERVVEAQGITLKFDEALVRKIAEWGYSPIFGARPLRNVISEKLQGVLAEKILRNEISKGETLRITLEGEEVRFVK